MFTLIYVGGFACVILLLLLGLIRNRRRPVSTAAIPTDLPKDVRKRLGSTSTNRGLRALRWLFILLSLALFGFHVYWAKYAADRNEKFQELGYKDLRTRRLSESTLRGWILDRSGRLDQPLAYYRRDSSGEIHREYPLDKALSHLFGSDRGDPGLERALFGVQSGAMPEALDVVRGRTLQFKGNQDVRLTIDRTLQLAAVDQLKESLTKNRWTVFRNCVWPHSYSHRQHFHHHKGSNNRSRCCWSQGNYLCPTSRIRLQSFLKRPTQL